MVKIPYIKIPSVRVGSIGPTSNIGTGGATPAPPTPITYLTQWKIVGNSEVHGQEIWSCGEYSATDGKYHIRILPEGYGVVDIALTEPLRKVNDVADTIEFADGVAIVVRCLHFIYLGDLTYTENYQNANYTYFGINTTIFSKYKPKFAPASNQAANILCAEYETTAYSKRTSVNRSVSIISNLDYRVAVHDVDYDSTGQATNLKQHLSDVGFIYELATPTTETIQVPQIEEAESYTCEISQGAKAVEWSSFTTNSE